jgi:tetrapyrrole methylase family protein/MazG family protein
VEIEEAWSKGDAQHLQEEIGDLIQASISLAVFCKLDPHETLSKSIQKFQNRYDSVVQLAKEDGLTHLHQQPFDIMMDYWNRAKIKNRTSE